MSWRRAFTPGRPRKSGRPAPAPGLLAVGAGGPHNRHATPGRVHVGRGAGLVQVAAAAGIGQVDVAAVLQGGQEAAFGKIEGVVVGGGNGVNAHPLQFVQVARVGAGVGGAAPLPTAFVVVEQHLQVDQGNVGGSQYLYQLEEAGFLEVLHPAGNHGVAAQSNGNVAALGIVNGGHGCLLAVSGKGCSGGGILAESSHEGGFIHKET